MMHRPNNAATRFLLPAGVCTLILLTFCPVLRVPFAPFDDEIQIITNPHIRSFSAENLRWMFTDTALTQRYTPLSWITWTALAQVTGVRPAPFHLLAILVHLLNATLVYLLIDTVIQRTPFGNAGRGFRSWSAMLGTLAWALHPMRVEVVAWATQVRYSEAAACAIGSILCYFSAKSRHDTPLIRQPWYWLSVLLYTASLLFYPSAILLPLLLPLVDRCFFPAPGRPGSRRTSLLAILPFLPAAAVIGLMTLAGRHDSSALWGNPVPLSQFGILERISQAASVCSFYLVKPFDFRYFSPVYPALIDQQALSFPYVANLVLIALLSLLAIQAWRRFPWLSLLWAAHLAFMLPFGGYFERPHLLCDRYNYLDAILFSTCLSAGLHWISVRPARLVAIVGSAVVTLAAIPLAIGANRQIRMWSTPQTTIRGALEHVQSTSFAAELYWQLGRYLMFEGSFQEALDACRRSLSLHPRNQGIPLAVMAEIYHQQALDLESHKAAPSDVRHAHLLAAESMDQALADTPAPEPLSRVAKAYLNAGQPDLARIKLLSALALDPRRTDDRLLLAQLLAGAGDSAAALQQLDLAIQYAPALGPQRSAIITALHLSPETTQPASAPQSPSHTAPSTSTSR